MSAKPAPPPDPAQPLNPEPAQPPNPARTLNPPPASKSRRPAFRDKPLQNGREPEETALRRKLEQELRLGHSRAQADRIAAWTGGSAARFAVLFSFFRSGPPVLRQRAGWALSRCCEKRPKLILPWLPDLPALAGEPGVHDAVPRNIFRILEICPLPEELHGVIYAMALAAVRNPGGAAAVQAYAITVLRRITDLYPELREEARLSLQELRPGAGAAVLSRMRRDFAM